MIDAIASVTSAATALELPPQARAAGTDFSRLLGQGLLTLDARLDASDQALRDLAAGRDIPLHDVMIAMERARVGLQLAVEVRNRVVEAYQQLTQMQL